MSKTSLHAQGYEGWLNEFLGISGAPWIKFVNCFPELPGINIIAL